MFRLDINQNDFTLSYRNEHKALQKPVLLITKSGEDESASGTARVSRTKLCEEGMIPSSSVYKQTQKVTLENNDLDKIVIERVEENEQHNPFPNKWTFKLSQGDVTRTFRASTPDAVLAYEYYFHQVKRDILQGQLR